jgi:hypothetical protein
LHHFNPVVSPAKHRSDLGRPDVIARLKIWDGRRKYDRCADLTERREIVAVRDVVAEVVTHDQKSGL